jgi:hypothetical protein
VVDKKAIHNPSKDRPFEGVFSTSLSNFPLIWASSPEDAKLMVVGSTVVKKECSFIGRSFFIDFYKMVVIFISI